VTDPHRRAERVDDPPGDLDRGGRLGDVAAQHDELVAAEASHRVLGPDHLEQARRDRRQDAVASGMAVLVVDSLEAVEVDEVHGDGPRPAVGSQERELESVQEERAVGHVGEPVVQRLVGELALEALALDGIADGSAQQRRVDLPLGQVVLSALLQCAQRHGVVSP
jgi:hypothetical protein